LMVVQFILLSHVAPSRRCKRDRVRPAILFGLKKPSLLVLGSCSSTRPIYIENSD
jgi:hypothetical protein